MRRGWCLPALSVPPLWRRPLATEAVKRKAVRALPDFSLIWECERRLEPFGATKWEHLTLDHVASWTALAGAQVKKHVIMDRIAADLCDPTHAGTPPLQPHEAYSFSARVTGNGAFAPEAPVASLPCRMFRVYGPHRFLRVHYEDIPKVGQRGRGGGGAAAAQLLVRLQHSRLGVISFAGRRWELLYADLAKRILVYFAVRGVLVKECSVDTVREWHIPFATAPANMAMTLPKYNARFSMGFSESIATVAFDALQEVPDVVNAQGAVMSDGCAAMPLWAMQQIATAAQLPTLPSVVQGRIGAAKGVWYLDPFVANPQVRPSQRKWELPFPTLEQRRFELCEWSRDRGPASLNYQFIHVLLHLGVPMETFSALLHEHGAQLRSDVVSRPHRMSQSQVLPMIEAGFDPERSGYLKRLLSNAAGAAVGRLGERMRIPVNRSRWLMVVADPSGCLQFGQAYVHPSHMLQPLKGRIVAARNPCHLPSDVQVMECVAEPRLAHIRDALVLPVHGPYAPAQLLSGGDYDGDLVFVSWDTRLLPPAGCPERMPPPALPVNREVVSPEAVGDGTAPAVIKTMRECAGDVTSATLDMFRGHTPVLGILTQIHAAIAEKEGVASAAARRVAWLCRDAVDAPKSGARVRIPRALAATYGKLSREQVLPALRAEATAIRRTFSDEGGASAVGSEDGDDGPSPTAVAVRDEDLVLPQHVQWLTVARAEYAAWRLAVRSALAEEQGSSRRMDAVRGRFRQRFVQHAGDSVASRLELASAYYVCSASSPSQAFAFGICFRELLRLKADARELRETNDVALSVVGSRRKLGAAADTEEEKTA